MATYKLPHFGQLDPVNLDEYYDVGIDFNGKEIQIDLNFENKTIGIKRLDMVGRFLEKLNEFDEKNKKYMEQDYKDEEGDTVRTYIEHHLQEIDKDELNELVDFDNKLIEPATQLMEKLQLVRVGLYPDAEDQFATFDYSIGEEFTNYLVVINIDAKGKLDYMTMES